MTAGATASARGRDEPLSHYLDRVLTLTLEGKGMRCPKSNVHALRKLGCGVWGSPFKCMSILSDRSFGASGCDTHLGAAHRLGTAHLNGGLELGLVRNGDHPRLRPGCKEGLRFGTGIGFA